MEARLCKQTILTSSTMKGDLIALVRPSRGE
jgi:hypothetical protein